MAAPSEEPTRDNGGSEDSSIDQEPEPEEVEEEGAMQQETWVDWIQRATHLAEDHARRAGVEDWVKSSTFYKFRVLRFMVYGSKVYGLSFQVYSCKWR